MTDLKDGPEFGQATIEDCEREQIHIPGSIQPHAALLVLRDGVVIQSSANFGRLLGLESDRSPNGRRLGEVLPADAVDVLTELDVSDGQRRTTGRIRLGSDVHVDVVRLDGQDDITLYQFEPVDGSVDIQRSFQDAVTEAVVRLQAAQSSSEIIDRACRVVRELTGFDRVMGYRFEPDDHGVVVAEAKREDLHAYLGLHFPASDIPAQARQMYLTHWLRSIPDVEYEAVPVEPTLVPGTGQPLDMSALDSRSVSPIHCEYLTNMGVGASMSISIVVEGRLWGLVACHHYSGPCRLSVPVREACEFIALTTSVMIGSQLTRDRIATDLRIEQVVADLAEELILSDDLADGLTSEPTRLTDLIDADGAAVVVGGSVSTVGRTPHADRIRAIAEFLSTEPTEGIYASDTPTWARDGAGESGDHGDGTIEPAGVLALPLSSLQRNYVIWFRQPWRQEVRWGGEPAKAIRVRADGSKRLIPRASFDEWVETVEGRSRPWTPDDLRAAAALKTLIGNHITRTVDQLGRLNAELARSNAELDAFAYVAAHDLKEPLRGMANYAAFLTEDYADVLDDAGREQLAMMTKLADRMTDLLGSLLDYARVGRSEIVRRQTTLSEIVADTTQLLTARLAESGAKLDLVSDGDLDADPELVSQVLMNLITNALKYNDSPSPEVEIGLGVLSRTQRGLASVRSSVLLDSESTVVFVRDNGIGIAPDRLSDVFRVFRRLHGPGEYGGGAGAGLTIARRIVERHDGAIWVESTPGEGSTFYFTLGPL